MRLLREAEGQSRLEGLAESIARIAAELVGADQATLGLVRGEEVETVAALYPRRLPLGSRFPVGYGVAGWVAATGRAAEIAEVRDDRRYVPLPYPEVRSFLALPLRLGMANADLVGVLSLAAWRPAAFPRGSAESLAPLAEHAAYLIRESERWSRVDEKMEALQEQVAGPMAEALHELKAPLNALMGFVDLVAGGHAGPLNARQQDFLQTGLGEARRLRDSLSALIEAGAAEGRTGMRAIVQPRSLLDDAALHARGLAAENGVRVEVHAPRALPQILVDRAAILQVLTNLVQNAMRVTPPGSTITLSATHAQVDGAPALLFAVDDEGPGFPAGSTHHLFEHYRQDAQSNDTRRPGDVGLGLWLSRRIVEAHGGTIWAENRQPNGRGGVGGRICLALPLAGEEGIPSA